MGTLLQSSMCSKEQRTSFWNRRIQETQTFKVNKVTRLDKHIHGSEPASLSPSPAADVVSRASPVPTQKEWTVCLSLQITVKKKNQKIKVRKETKTKTSCVAFVLYLPAGMRQVKNTL